MQGKNRVGVRLYAFCPNPGELGTVQAEAVLEAPVFTVGFTRLFGDICWDQVVICSHLQQSDVS